MNHFLDISLKILVALSAIGIPVLNFLSANGRINKKSKSRKSIAEIIKESHSLITKDEQFTATLEAEYKQAVYTEILGVNITMENYLILTNNTDLKNISRRTIRRLWPFLFFENGYLSIRVKVIDYFASGYMLIAPITVVVMVVNALLNDQIDFTTKTLYTIIIVVFGTFWVYALYSIVIPFVWALQLKKKLKPLKSPQSE